MRVLVFLEERRTECVYKVSYDDNNSHIVERTTIDVTKAKFFSEPSVRGGIEPMAVWLFELKNTCFLA